MIAFSACSSTPAVGSIGAVLGRDGETREVFVRETPEPAAGDRGPSLIPGDQIVMVEGVYVRDLPTKDLRALLRGEPGTEVNLTIVRGSEVMRLKIKRTSLKAKLLPGKEERISED